VQFPEDRQNRINKFSLLVRRTEIKTFKFSNKIDILPLVKSDFQQVLFDDDREIIYAHEELILLSRQSKSKFSFHIKHKL